MSTNFCSAVKGYYHQGPKFAVPINLRNITVYNHPPSSILCCYRHGAEEVEPTASGGAGRSRAFQGRAYRLGDSEGASEVISSAARLPDHPQVQPMSLP